MKEIHRLTITTTRRLRLSVGRASCPVCGCEVVTLSHAEAIAVLGLSGKQFYELVTAGHLHTIPLVRGGWGVCRNSLFV